MNLLRAFIAIEIPPEIHNAIEHETASLRAALSSSLVRWVPSTNIHLTLKFLGDNYSTNVETIAQTLDTEISQHPTFKIQFGGSGVFPNPKRPRVIWIGLQVPAALKALQLGLEAATAKLGYPVEKRPFSPHLTIGRIKPNVASSGIQKIEKVLTENLIGSLGSAQIIAVHLFKSDLKPTGAVYTKLHTVSLRNE